MSQDRFLGAWDVTEFIYSAEGQALGTLRQQRRLYADSLDDSIVVEQHCRPADSLRGHPMEAFAGDFRFRLQKSGRERHYQGPDVEGLGLSFGENYLCGSGVWPRFGYNFRSWSVRLDDTRQLTGGVFFRGHHVVAVIFGIGQQVEGETRSVPSIPDQRIHGGSGSTIQLDLATDSERSATIQRQLIDAGSWHEVTADQTEIFQLEARGAGQSIIQRRDASGTIKARGTALAYGPLLSWETHGGGATSTLGLEISDPFANQQFSIRQHFKRGQLLRLEGLHFRE